MYSHSKWRLRARAALETYFQQRSQPRFTLGLLVSVAGLAGLLISHGLLHFGVEEMWKRYPAAVLGGYGVFLVQLRLWVEIERARYDHGQVTLPDEAPDESPRRTLLESLPDSGSRWLDWLDIPNSPDLGEGCFVGCLIVVLIGLVASAAAALLSFVMGGAAFLAEVFLDAFVVTVFYRHLKTAATEHWLGTAVRRSWFVALLTAGVLALLGGILDLAAPNSHTLWAALQKMFSAL